MSEKKEEKGPGPDFERERSHILVEPGSNKKAAIKTLVSIR